MNVTINVVIYVIITTGPEFFMQSCQWHFFASYRYVSYFSYLNV
jgi:hypothetical protein